MQDKIKYTEIMNLGFEEEIQSDPVYFDEHGFDWAIITKHLTKKIFLNWEKENQLCQIIRVDKDNNIKKKQAIRNLAHLKSVIDFFTDSK